MGRPKQILDKIVTQREVLLKIEYSDGKISYEQLKNLNKEHLELLEQWEIGQQFGNQKAIPCSKIPSQEVVSKFKESSKSDDSVRQAAKVIKKIKKNKNKKKKGSSSHSNSNASTIKSKPKEDLKKPEEQKQASQKFLEEEIELDFVYDDPITLHEEAHGHQAKTSKDCCINEMIFNEEKKCWQFETDGEWTNYEDIKKISPVELCTFLLTRIDF